MLSSVILSRLYGAHATHTWRYFPLDIRDILQKSAVPQWLQCIQFRRPGNETDDLLDQALSRDVKVWLPMELGKHHLYNRCLLPAQTTTFL